MSTITIITVWNKEDVFRRFQASLETQKGVEYTLLGVDNSQNRYSSARQAFHDQKNRVETEYVAFMHQDILFSDENALADIVSQVQKLTNLGIAGVAGCPEGKRWRLLSSIVHGPDAAAAGEHVDAPQRVQTVDECLFIMPTEVFQKHPFSEKTGWHMYAVEQCLNLLKAGYQNYVVPARLWHLSNGNSLDHTYLYTLEELIGEVSTDTDYLNTTVKQWKTKGIFALLYRKYYLQKMKLKGFLKNR